MHIYWRENVWPLTNQLTKSCRKDAQAHWLLETDIIKLDYIFGLGMDNLTDGQGSQRDK